MSHGDRGECDTHEWAEEVKRQEEWCEQYGGVIELRRPSAAAAPATHQRLSSLGLHQLSSRRKDWCDIEFARTVEDACAKAWGIKLEEVGTKGGKSACLKACQRYEDGDAGPCGDKCKAGGAA